jgi:putative phage-type endonuclease
MTKAKHFDAFGPFEVHTPEWHAHRQRSIGASEVASILGVPGAYQTPLQVWASKRGISIDEKENEARDDWLHFGLALEPLIADEFQKRSKKVVVPEERQFISVPYPFLGCSLDKWFMDPEGKEGDFDPLDLKNTSIFMRDEWEGTVPLRYNVQIQAQMTVTGRDQGALAVLIGGNRFKWAIIDRDQRFIDLMLEKLEKFWEMVQADIMPDPVAKDNAVIGQILGQEDEGKTIVLSPEIVGVDTRLVVVKEEIKILKTEKDALEAKIKKEIGTNAAGMLPEGGRYSFKTGTRQSYTVAEATTRTLRRAKK